MQTAQSGDKAVFQHFCSCTRAALGWRSQMKRLFIFFIFHVCTFSHLIQSEANHKGIETSQKHQQGITNDTCNKTIKEFIAFYIKFEGFK